MTIQKALKKPWLSPKTAPKDKTFIGIFTEYPYPSQAHWNAASKGWVYVIPQVELLDGKWNDHYFETVSAKKEDLIAWVPMEEWKWLLPTK